MSRVEPRCCARFRQNGDIGLPRRPLGWLPGEIWLGNRQRGCTSAGTDSCCAGWSMPWCAVMSGCSTIRFARNRFRYLRCHTCRDHRCRMRRPGVPSAARRARQRACRHGARLWSPLRARWRHRASRAQSRISTAIAGTPANPEAVSAAAIINSKRGPLVGIPGAPATISTPLGDDESGWAVCDDATSTTVIAGNVLGDGLASGRGVLVMPRSESAATTYLLYDGWRAKVDLRNRALVRALKLDGVAPRPVSRALWTRRPRRLPSPRPIFPAPAHRARCVDFP